MRAPDVPKWLDQARHFYSQIGPDLWDPVTVFAVALDQEVSSASPGMPILHLRRQRRGLQVLDAGGQEVGAIRFAIPGVKYVMSRGDTAVWTLTVRSLLRKRLRLVVEQGGTWTFDTPFFWWQHLSGKVNGIERLVGFVGPSKRFWVMAIEPDRDTVDLLAAVGSMHRSWWHS